MARYIENLNSCTDPTSGDYLWIVDASAGATDKDRKVDVGLFPRLAVANTFTAGQTFTPGTGAGIVVNQNGNNAAIRMPQFDNGTGTGPTIEIGRNSNASTPAPGVLILGKVNTSGNAMVWSDDSGIIRTALNTIIDSTNRNGGTVVGAQTSMLAAKTLLGDETPIADVLAAVQAGADAVRHFVYKDGRFNAEEFEGVVVDYAPRYGMDNGKSLNEVTVIGDLLRAVAWLIEKVQGT